MRREDTNGENVLLRSLYVPVGVKGGWPVSVILVKGCGLVKESCSLLRSFPMKEAWPVSVTLSDKGVAFLPVNPMGGRVAVCSWHF